MPGSWPKATVSIHEQRTHYGAPTMKLSRLGQSYEKPASAVKATGMSKADSQDFYALFSEIRSLSEEIEAVRTNLRKSI